MEQLTDVEAEMATEDFATLQIEISAQDVSPEDIDGMTRQLLSELRELDVESVELAHGGAVPAGAKAVDPITAGTIAMTVLPALLPKVIDFIQAWAMRGSGRTSQFKGKIGRNQIDFEGPPEELKKILDTLGTRRRKPA